MEAVGSRHRARDDTGGRSRRAHASLERRVSQGVDEGGGPPPHRVLHRALRRGGDTRAGGEPCLAGGNRSSKRSATALDSGLPLSTRPNPTVALDVGGGIINALSLLGESPFIVASADVWSDYPFRRMLAGPKGLAHLVLVDNPPYYPRGDFGLNGEQVGPGGTLRLTYGGIGVFRPDLFTGRSEGRHPLLPILQEAIGRGEASGEHYRGRWFNVGTPGELAALDGALRSEGLGAH